VIVAFLCVGGVWWRFEAFYSGISGEICEGGGVVEVPEFLLSACFFFLCDCVLADMTLTFGFLSFLLEFQDIGGCFREWIWGDVELFVGDEERSEG
jgi:hypothetical protein